jgi:hypothetical protein
MIHVRLWEEFAASIQNFGDPRISENCILVRLHPRCCDLDFFGMRKIFSPNWLRCYGPSLVLAGSVLWFTGCAVRGVAYSNGPALDYYDYDYYPDTDVYFYPRSHVYYWHDGDRWRSGGRLPPRYKLHEERREHLRLHSREPWREHREHEEHEHHDERR